MKIALNAGHTISGTGSGAVGVINESTETRVMCNMLKDMFKRGGHTVYDCTIDKSSNYLPEAVKKANAQTVDLAVSIHFNSASGGANGTEVLVYDTYTSLATTTADRVCKEIAAKGYKNRGRKVRQELYWLKWTNAKAILIECCFVQDPDASKYKANKKAMAEAIYKGITGQNPPAEKTEYPIGDYHKDVIVDTGDGSNLNARSGRGAEFAKIGSFANGSRVNVWYIDKAKDGSLWGSCSCNGQTAFIHMGYTRPL